MNMKHLTLNSCSQCLARWHSGRVPDLQSIGRGFESQPPRSSATPGKLLTHTCASVIKQYNLVPANRWRCLAAGKVNVDLASHWLRITDINGSPPTGSRPEGRKRAPNPTYDLLWSTVDFTFMIPVTVTVTCQSSSIQMCVTHLCVSV